MMSNTLGIIDYNNFRNDQRKSIFVSCRCTHCQKIAILSIDCPDRLQGAKPGSFVTIDADGRLQVREEP
jgi:hypothetical protein